jgi:hypothetical protein
MKRPTSNLPIYILLITLFLSACGPTVTLTTWKNKEDNRKVSKVVVMALFGKLEYAKPVEQSVAAYFNKMGLKSMEALDFLNPTRKYEEAEIRSKLDSLGADGILVFTYKGTDITKDFIPPDYYGYYGGPWWYGYGWGYGLTSGGYWTTTKVVNIRASLYPTSTKAAKGALWTADVKITDPDYIDKVATSIAERIFAEWQKENLLK